MSWARRRRTFWRNASQGMGLASGAFLLTGFATGTGTLIALGIPCAILTLSFGRRAR